MLSYLWNLWIASMILLYVFLSWVRRQLKIDGISKKHILVTGCDSGFGQLLVKKLDHLGCQVFAACLTEAGQNHLNHTTSTRVKTLLMDVSKADNVRQALEFVKKNLPQDEGLWGLVNNAGTIGSILGPPEWHTDADFQHVLEVNALGIVRITLAFLPLLKKSQGRVVNMSSMAGRLANPMTLPYCMSKYAVEAFSDGLRQHLHQYCVSVHILEPGSFATTTNSATKLASMTQRGFDEAPRPIREEFGQQYTNRAIDVILEQMVKGTSPNLDKVIKAYVHALTARHPRIRYTVGWDARLLYLPLSYMPSIITDFLSSQTHAKLIPAVLK